MSAVSRTPAGERGREGKQNKFVHSEWGGTGGREPGRIGGGRGTGGGREKGGKWEI